jgi:hypothetical protein
MFSIRRGSWFAWTVPVLLALTASSARAETIILRNDTQMLLQIRPASVFAGVVNRPRPILLAPKASTPGITLPGDKIIVIVDGNVPTRILFKGTIPAAAKNSAWSIQPDLPAPRVKLVPIPFPMPPGP